MSTLKFYVKLGLVFLIIVYVMYIINVKNLKLLIKFVINLKWV